MTLAMPSPPRRSTEGRQRGTNENSGIRRLGSSGIRVRQKKKKNLHNSLPLPRLHVVVVGWGGVEGVCIPSFAWPGISLFYFSLILFAIDKPVIRGEKPAIRGDTRSEARTAGALCWPLLAALISHGILNVLCLVVHI